MPVCLRPMPTNRTSGCAVELRIASVTNVLVLLSSSWVMETMLGHLLLQVLLAFVISMHAALANTVQIANCLTTFLVATSLQRKVRAKARRPEAKARMIRAKAKARAKTTRVRAKARMTKVKAKVRTKAKVKEMAVLPAWEVTRTPLRLAFDSTKEVVRRSIALTITGG